MDGKGGVETREKDTNAARRDGGCVRANEEAMRMSGGVRHLRSLVVLISNIFEFQESTSFEHEAAVVLEQHTAVSVAVLRQPENNTATQVQRQRIRHLQCASSSDCASLLTI